MAERKPIFNSGGGLVELATPDTIRGELVIDLLNYRKSGRLMTAGVNTSAIGTVALAANQVRAYPLIVTRSVTITALVSAVTVAVAGSSFRMGIYSDNGSIYPGALVSGSDVVAYSGAAVAVVTGTLATNITLSPGLYWLATLSSATPTVRGLPAASIANVIGIDPATPTMIPNGYVGTVTFGNMPVTFPANMTASNQTVLPLVGLKVL